MFQLIRHDLIKAKLEVAEILAELSCYLDSVIFLLALVVFLLLHIALDKHSHWRVMQACLLTRCYDWTEFVLHSRSSSVCLRYFSALL